MLLFVVSTKLAFNIRRLCVGANMFPSFALEGMGLDWDFNSWILIFEINFKLLESNQIE